MTPDPRIRHYAATLPNGTRADTNPPYWPFAPLTTDQQRRHAAQVAAMRAGQLLRSTQVAL